MAFSGHTHFLVFHIDIIFLFAKDPLNLGSKLKSIFNWYFDLNKIQAYCMFTV